MAKSNPATITITQEEFDAKIAAAVAAALAAVPVKAPKAAKAAKVEAPRRPLAELEALFGAAMEAAGIKKGVPRSSVTPNWEAANVLAKSAGYGNFYHLKIARAAARAATLKAATAGESVSEDFASFLAKLPG
jgi:hypothetical protein